MRTMSLGQICLHHHSGNIQLFRLNDSEILKRCDIIFPIFQPKLFQWKNICLPGHWQLLHHRLQSQTCQTLPEISVSLLYFNNSMWVLLVCFSYCYYLPSGLFVVVSWVSFLIPPEVKMRQKLLTFNPPCDTSAIWYPIVLSWARANGYNLLLTNGGSSLKLMRKR